MDFGLGTDLCSAAIDTRRPDGAHLSHIVSHVRCACRSLAHLLQSLPSLQPKLNAKLSGQESHILQSDV